MFFLFLCLLGHGISLAAEPGDPAGLIGSVEGLVTPPASAVPLALEEGSVTESPGVARFEAASKLWAWTDSQEPVTDRDGDGKPDAWREFYRSGKLKLLRLASRGSGAPDYVVLYSPSGRVLRQEIDRNSDGTMDVVSETGEREGNNAEVTAFREPLMGGFSRWVTVWKSRKGYYKKLTELDLDGDARPERRYEQVVPPTGWSVVTGVDVTPCDPGLTPTLSGEQLDWMAGNLASLLPSRINVSSGCAGYRFGNEPVMAAASDVRAAMSSAVQTGLECLRGKGPNGARMADQVLAQVFSSSSRPLRIDCNTPDVVATCPDGTTVTHSCGRASAFDDSAYPRVALASGCGVERGPGRRQTFAETAFHEILHLGGEPGHQHLHNYSDVTETETVELCALCCMGRAPTSDRQTRACQLCTADRPVANPVRYQLQHGMIELENGNYWVAQRKLEMAALFTGGAQMDRTSGYNDTDRLVWTKLLDAYVRGYRNLTDPKEKKKLLFRIRYARDVLRRATGLGENPLMDIVESGREPPPDVMERSMLISDATDLIGAGLKKELATPNPPREGYLHLRQAAELADMTLNYCASMSDATSPLPAAPEGTVTPEQIARGCHTRARHYVFQMQSAITALDESNAAAESGGGTILSEQVLAPLRTRLANLTAAIGCRARGVPLEECEGVTLTPAAPASAASGSPEGCPPASARLE